MNPLDFLSSYTQDNPNPNPVVPPEVYGDGSPDLMSAGAAQVGTPPSILDLLAQIKTPEVQMPQANPRDALTPALFQFAQAVTAPRRRSQSSGNAILSALNQGMGTYTKARDAGQDRAIQQEIMKRKLQESELGMQRDKLAIVGAGQQIEERGKQGVREQEKHDAWKEREPLEFKRAQQLLDNAKTEGEVNRADLIIKQAKAKYADQLAKAEVAHKSAQTTREKAAAELKADQARFWLEKALFHEQEIANKAKRDQKFKAVFQTGDIMTGTPHRWIKDNKYYTASHSPAEAVKLAEADARAQATLGEFSEGDSKYKEFLRKRAAHYTKGDVVPEGESTTPPLAPGAQPTNAPTGTAAPGKNGDADKSRESLAKPGMIFQDPDNPNVFWLNGRQIDKAQADKLRTKAGQQAAAPRSGEGSSFNREMGM